ncbi:hypothetical protein ABZ114_03060 [Streptomyces albidoflavus]|uniref:hypothetical protein n=1 Tax=Streptomyces albidoflavus TaxID=1886 RepID=UPI00339E63F5
MHLRRALDLNPDVEHLDQVGLLALGQLADLGTQLVRSRQNLKGPLLFALDVSDPGLDPLPLLEEVAFLLLVPLLQLGDLLPHLLGEVIVLVVVIDLDGCDQSGDGLLPRLALLLHRLVDLGEPSAVGLQAGRGRAERFLDQLVQPVPVCYEAGHLRHDGLLDVVRVQRLTLVLVPGSLANLLAPVLTRAAPLVDAADHAGPAQADQARRERVACGRALGLR